MKEKIFRIYNTRYKLKNFIHLYDDEIIYILKMRNHKNIKKWMYNQNNITLCEHFNFIKNLKNNKKDSLYFVVKHNKQVIGVIDFTNIDRVNKTCEFGLYANPFEKIKEVGNILLEIVIKYAFNILGMEKLNLEVFADNEKAISLYKKYNFREIKRKIIDNREVICMELTNENRKF